MHPTNKINPVVFNFMFTLTDATIRSAARAYINAVAAGDSQSALNAAMDLERGKVVMVDMADYAVSAGIAGIA